MAAFTTHDSITLIDIARSKDENGDNSSARGFILKILELPNTAKPSHEQVNFSRDEIRQGNKILEAINNQTKILTEEHIIENIRNNIVSAKSIELIDEVLINEFLTSDNMTDDKKEEFKKASDFSARLFIALKYSLKRQKYDNTPENQELILTKSSMYSELESNVNEIEGYKSSEESRALNETLLALKNVSDFIFKSLYDPGSRFSEYKVDPKLLTLGSEKTLKTYGVYDKQSKPMSSYFSMKENLFIHGEGGIGKTYFLINELTSLKEKDKGKYIPIFMSLTKLKEKKYHSSYIKSELLSLIEEVNYPGIKRLKFDSHTQEVYLTELLKYKNANRTILLMLDGYNEISSLSSSLIRDEIKKEIEELATYSNVRIILTSRPFYKHEESFKSFKHIKATGINYQTLEKYLEKNDIPLPESDELVELLRVPLFLIMHKHNHDNGVKTATTRGAILYEYFNGTKGIYTELRLIKDPKYNLGTKLPEYAPLLFDFIMPAIAAMMEMNDSFSINPVQLHYVVSMAESLTRPFDTNGDTYFSKYESRNALTALARDLVSSTTEVTALLTDRISFLEQDSNNNISFTHQHIKDYFASLFRIFSYRQQFKNVDDLYYDFAHYPMDVDTVNLIKEIAVQSALCDVKTFTSIFNECPDKKDHVFITNLFKLLSAFNNDSLADFTFEGFDLSSVSLPSFKFSAENKAASFDNCKFSETSFHNNEASQRTLRYLEFYKGKPAIFEVIPNKHLSFFKVIDFKTGNIILSKIWDAITITDEFASDMENMSALIVSNNGKYLILYNSAFLCDYFFVYNVETSEIARHYFPENTHLAIFSFKSDNEFAVATNEVLVTVYNLDYKEPNWAEYFSKLGTSDEIAEFKYEGKITTYVFDDEDFDFPYGLQDFYFVGDLIVGIFSSNELDKVIYVYSDFEAQFLNIDIPKNLEIKETSHITSCLYKNCIYFNFNNSVYEFNADTLSVRLIRELKNCSFAVTISCIAEKLYVSAGGDVLVISVQDGEILNSFTRDYYVGLNHYICNDNYLVYAGISPMLCQAYIYRLDIMDYDTYSYGKRISIKNIFYLTHNRIIIVYSSGYVAMIDGKTMKAIEVFSLPSDKDFLSLDHNSTKEHLAVSVCDKNKLETPTTIYILDVSYNEDNNITVIKHFDNHYHQNNLCYSNNGKYLFENNMGTIIVYDTNDYNIFTELETGEELSSLKAIDDSICLFTQTDILDINFGSEVAVIDTNNIPDTITFNHVFEVENSDDPYVNDKLLIPFISHVYEAVNPTKTPEPDIYKRLVNIVSRENSSRISDFFEDGLLVKCSARELNFDYPNTITDRGLSPNFGHYDKKNNLFYCVDKANAFGQVDIENPISKNDTQVIPGLLIQGCKFNMNTSITPAIYDIIHANLGTVIY